MISIFEQVLGWFRFCTYRGWYGVFIANIAKHILILALHINGCMLTGGSLPFIKVFKEETGLWFWITYLRWINWLLGMKVTWDHQAHTISLLQELYISRCHSTWPSCPVVRKTISKDHEHVQHPLYFNSMLTPVWNTGRQWSEHTGS